MEQNDGKMEIIKSLALECGPIIETHYKEKKTRLENEVKDSSNNANSETNNKGGDTLKLKNEKRRQQPIESTGTFEAFDTSNLNELRQENDKDFMKYFVSPTNSKQSISGDELANNKTLYISSTLVYNSTESEAINEALPGDEQQLVVLSEEEKGE